MTSHDAELHLVRETKGALRYEGTVGSSEDPHGATRLIGVLYLRKAAVQQHMLEDGDSDWPQTISVEVVPKSC